MFKRFLIVVGILLTIGLTACKSTKNLEKDLPGSGVRKLDLHGFKNLYKVNEQLFRSDQPNVAGMKALEQMGIKTIIDLRHYRNDKREARNTRLALLHYPINTRNISYEDLLKVLILIEKSEKPVLVHCWHGSDRTGSIVAAYRIVHDGWTKEQAIQEFTDNNYGYHEKWFPNILVRLKTLDVERLKRDFVLLSSASF